MTSVTLTGTNHAEDQPVHLRVIKTKDYITELEGLKNPAAGAGIGAVKAEAEIEAVSQEDVDAERERRIEHVKVNVGEYAGLLGRACPAGVYEYVDVEGENKGEDSWEGKKLVINSQVGVFTPLCRVDAHEPPLELHSLQAVRYQGPFARYHLDCARGERWSQIQYVLDSFMQ